jgi:Rieske Fe-S protein
MIRRRTFLKLVGSAAAANACVAGGGVSPENVGDVAAGSTSALSVGSLVAISGQPACIGRNAMGVYAMTLTCTHQGCDMGRQGSVSPRGLDCSCHGSQFDANGNVVRGPANLPLAHFAVSEDTAGNLTVHTGSEVDPSVRLMVG